MWLVLSLSVVVAVLASGGSTVQAAEGPSAASDVPPEVEPTLPDPRYPRPTEWPEFPSPEEFVRNAHPADADYIDEMVEARGAEGLSTDRTLIEDLVTQAGSQDDVREFGFVVTDEERAALLSDRDRQVAAIELKEQLALLDGWAGSREIQSDQDSFGGLEVWITVESMEEAQSIVTRNKETVARVGTVTLVEREHSWTELRMLARELDNAVDDPEQARVSSDEASDGAAALRRIGTTGVGYSVAENELVANLSGDPATASGQDVERRDDKYYLRSGLAVDVRVQREDVAQPDTGPDNCSRDGCGPTRAGLSFPRANLSAHCTVGFPITDSGDEDYSTAGHCSGTARSVYLQRETGSYPGLFTFDRGVGSWAHQSSGYYSGSRLDAVEIGVPDHLVTNRLYQSSSTAGRRITSVLSYGSISIGTDVCMHGRNNEAAQCGNVTDLGRSPDVGPFDLEDQIYAEYTSAGGDSGAPVTLEGLEQYAVGVNHGHLTDGSGRAVFGSVSHFLDVESGISVFRTTDRRRDFVLGAYSDGLGRFADSSGYSYWRNSVLSTCTVQRAGDFIYALLTGTEFRGQFSVNSTSGRQARVESLYWTGLDRRSDTSGFNYWYNYITAGTSTSDRENRWSVAAASLVAGSEFSTRVTSGASSPDGHVC